uniref:Acg family FMN-binding oxidoreductase n=1 Tax=Nocardia brasiliensis TaxID=37326 RepID=UPI003CC7FFC6
MGCAQPDADTVEAALAMAVRAPSVHNSQPWRWRIAGEAIQLYADPGRHLVATDPQQRGLILSCGAALHHLRVALAVLGWSAAVEHLPDPGDPDHLATVTLTPYAPTPTDFELSAALVHRQSDRRRYSSWQVPPGYLRTVATRAAQYGAVVRQVPDGLRARLARPARDAVARHAADPAYQLELAAWSGGGGGPPPGTRRGPPPAPAPAPLPRGAGQAFAWKTFRRGQNGRFARQPPTRGRFGSARCVGR